MRLCMAGIAVAVVTMVGAGLGAQETPVPVGKCVSIEIVLAESSGPIEVAASEAGALAEVTVERIQELEKQGQLASVARIRVATLENRAASVQFGERAPVAESRSMGPRTRDGGPPVASSYTMTNVGTMLEATPQVDENGAVILELQIEHSRLDRQPAGVSRAGGQDAEFVPPKIVTATAKSTVRIPAAKTVIMEAQQSARDVSRHVWILATAQVLDNK